MQMIATATFRKLMNSLRVPKGFQKEFVNKGWLGKAEFLTFVLTKPNDTKIIFDQSGSGHTEFTKEGSGEAWLSFDRVGVSDSFYWTEFSGKVKKGLSSIIPEQLKRVAESREYYKTAIKLPGIPFTVSPERLEELKTIMSNPNGHRAFSPSGFGTGYILMRKPRAPRYLGDSSSPRANPELEALLGVEPIYVDKFDAD